jgi:hypothetical protein
VKKFRQVTSASVEDNEESDDYGEEDEGDANQNREEDHFFDNQN